MAWQGPQAGEMPKPAVGMLERGTRLSCVDQLIAFPSCITSACVRIACGDVSAWAFGKNNPQHGSHLAIVSGHHDTPFFISARHDIAEGSCSVGTCGTFRHRPDERKQQRALQMCSEFGVAIPRTFLEGSMRSKVTWMHPLAHNVSTGKPTQALRPSSSSAVFLPRMSFPAWRYVQ